MEGVSSAEHEGICVLQSFFNMKMDRNKPMIIVKNTMETKRQCENLELLYVIRGEMSLVIEKRSIIFRKKTWLYCSRERGIAGRLGMMKKK